MLKAKTIKRMVIICLIVAILITVKVIWVVSATIGHGSFEVFDYVAPPLCLCHVFQILPLEPGNNPGVYIIILHLLYPFRNRRRNNNFRSTSVQLPFIIMVRSNRTACTPEK